MTDRSTTLRHVVLFWLRNRGSHADRDRLIAGLATLRAIPAVQSLAIGIPAATEQRDAVDHSFDVSEQMIFASERDQKAYQDHPIHQQFVRDYSHLWERHVVYDSVDVD